MLAGVDDDEEDGAPATMLGCLQTYNDALIVHFIMYTLLWSKHIDALQVSFSVSFSL